MGYTTPRTWVAGEYPTAAQLNANVRDNVSFLANPPACRVYHNAAQSITNATLTTLSFNSERFDTDSMHDLVTNNGRITINTAGLYMVTATVQFQGDSDYLRLIVDILLNGATIIGRNNYEFGENLGGNGQNLTVTTLYKVAVADYLQVRVFQQNTSAGANNIEVLANTSPEFSAVWVGLG